MSAFIENLYYLMILMKGLKHWFVPNAAPAEDFRVRGIGVRESMPSCVVNRPRGTADYLFMFFYDAVTIEQDGRAERVPPESFRVWEPRQRQDYGNPEESWNHSWIHCDGAFVAEALRETGLPVNRTVRLSDPSVMEKNLLELHGELTGHHPLDAGIAKDLFRVLLRRLARAAAGPAGELAPERFLALKRHLEAHFTQPFSLKEMADRVHLSVPHFCSEFKRYFNVPPLEFLIRLRMHVAAHHLGNLSHSITEVAEMAGYTDLFYFSKRFKKWYGMSPRAMRAALAAGSRSGLNR